MRFRALRYRPDADAERYAIALRNGQLTAAMLSWAGRDRPLTAGREQPVAVDA